MSAGTQMTPASPKMRANRKVTETNCSLCGRRFQLAEEVYTCPACKLYHHAVCLHDSGAGAALCGDVPEGGGRDTS